MNVNVKSFLARVEEIAAEEPSYRSGGTGKDGTCDCIGLIIGAIRRAGGTWSGTHGSNYAARYEVTQLQRIGSINDLRVGDAIFKAYEPGDAKYNLPARYRSGADQRDYCHVGVVISVNPLRIRHMTSPKPKMDTALGKWKYHGWLKKISTESAGDDEKMEQVTISGGNMDLPINARSGPSRDNKILFEIPQGSTAEVLEDRGDWINVSYNGRNGWVMKVFVHVAGSGIPADGSQIDGEAGTVTVPIAELEKIYDTLGDWLGLRG